MEQSPSWEADQLSQLTKKFPAFYGTRRFFTVLTSARFCNIFCRKIVFVQCAWYSSYSQTLRYSLREDTQPTDPSINVQMTHIALHRVTLLKYWSYSSANSKMLRPQSVSSVRLTFCRHGTEWRTSPGISLYERRSLRATNAGRYVPSL
jgi:hypothetical protein